MHLPQNPTCSVGLCALPAVRRVAFRSPDPADGPSEGRSTTAYLCANHFAVVAVARDLFALVDTVVVEVETLIPHA
jgi:hypothetical protein